jgi:DNA repair photolyase
LEEKEDNYLKGRGAQVNPNNRFFKQAFTTEHIEGIDEDHLTNGKTEIIPTWPKTIINRVDSPDLGMYYSLNPYQGCEHGCIYCYARNTHEYWGFSPGLDFERKIIAKQNVGELLEKEISKKTWQPYPIMVSGNTDCYQPIEKKLGLTKKVLEICLKYKHPVSMITKNALVIRDVGILKELAAEGLAHVMVSITGTDEKIRMMLEPRTSTYKNRFKILNVLSSNNIPCGVMVAPVIPGINIQEIPAVLKAAADNGATDAGYTVVRLNGAIGGIFKDWLFKNHPDRAAKVWNQICACHGGKVNDTEFGRRMSGEGEIAASIKQLFSVSIKKFFKNPPSRELRTDLFNYRAGEAQLRMDFGD